MGGTIALVLWASTWAAAGASDGAPAPAGNEAERLMRQGIDLRRAGRDEEALDCFRRADELTPSARARARVGLAEQALGRWVDASRDLASTLRSPLPLPLLPTNSPSGTDVDMLQHQQQMRRKFRSLSQQQDLGEIEAVATAMKLRPSIVETLKRWNEVYFSRADELDKHTVQSDKDAAHIMTEFGRLARSRKNAEIALLGNETFDRYQHLLTAYRGGYLEKALQRDPKAPDTSTTIRGEFQPSLPMDTSAYDGLFKERTQP